MTSLLTCAREPPGSEEVLPPLPLPLVPLWVAPSEVMTEVALLKVVVPVEVAFVLKEDVLQSCEEGTRSVGVE